MVVCIGLVATGARIAVPVSVAYPEVAYTFGYGRNVVNVTLVDIRSWDTMGEISVLVVAATGVASLIFLRSRYSGPAAAAARRPSRPAGRTGGRTVWLRGGETLSPARRSIVFEVVTRVLFPVMIVVSVYLLMAGHNAPGGGFAGGLVAGMALMIRYLAGRQPRAGRGGAGRRRQGARRGLAPGGAGPARARRCSAGGSGRATTSVDHGALEACRPRSGSSRCWARRTWSRRSSSTSASTSSSSG